MRAGAWLLLAACGGSTGGGDLPGGDEFAPWAGGPDYYAQWPAGPSTDPAFFPIAVWLQAPIPNGDAYRAIGVNTFVEMSWGGLDAPNLDAVAAQNMFATHSQTTDFATFVGRAPLIGWNHTDEPDNAQPDGNGGYGSCILPDAIAARSTEMRTAAEIGRASCRERV